MLGVSDNGTSLNRVTIIRGCDMNTRFITRPYLIGFAVDTTGGSNMIVQAYTAEDAYFQARVRLGKKASIYSVEPAPQTSTNKSVKDWMDD
jgi:hypothetical protein